MKVEKTARKVYDLETGQLITETNNKKQKTMKTTYLPEITLNKKKTDFQKVRIDGSEKAAEFIRQFYGDDLTIYESFFLLLLDRANNTIGFVKVSQGGITSTVADIRLICKYVIESLATGVIISHNHPSGNIRPSDADKLLTANVKKALKLFEVTLLDHVILTESDYYSFADRGELN